ncbi:MAG: DUF305 domain-containing protein [bacterium]
MENKNLLYGVIGLLAGIIIVNCMYSFHGSWNNYRNQEDRYSGNMMHKMSDGSMMNNVGMNNMDDMMQGMMSGLEGKTGDAFDKEFLAEMIAHHKGAVEMAQAVLKTSKRPELLKLATDIITAQTKEITMMQDWQKTWFK